MQCNCHTGLVGHLLAALARDMLIHKVDRQVRSIPVASAYAASVASQVTTYEANASVCSHIADGMSTLSCYTYVLLQAH